MSGMIYAVIVVMWAAFLVPMWLRRHDELAEAKSVDRFASKMRVLARRTGEADGEEPHGVRRPGTTAPVPRSSPATRPTRAAFAVPSRTVSSTVRIVGRDFRDRWADDADDVALAALAAPDLARDLARDRGYGRAPASLAVRRRRVLAVLAGAALVLVLLAALSVVPWLVAGASGAAAITYVLHLRVQAKRTGEIARRRARTAGTGPADATDRSPANAGSRPDARVSAAVELADTDEVDGWQPVSVPVPTYVNAPRAGRAIRRIDLHGEDAWTSGRLVADAAAAGRAAAAAAHQESVAAREADDAAVQRAVGD